MERALSSRRFTSSWFCASRWILKSAILPAIFFHLPGPESKVSFFLFRSRRELCGLKGGCSKIVRGLPMFPIHGALPLLCLSRREDSIMHRQAFFVGLNWLTYNFV
ncbi:hypothetical protein FKM82_031195 [Ascaphus truei]